MTTMLRATLVDGGSGALRDGWRQADERLQSRRIANAEVRKPAGEQRELKAES
jgi:hypothetical protein